MRGWARASSWSRRPTSRDGSFLKLSPTIAVVTNSTPSTWTTTRDLDAIATAFLDFVNKVPFYGAAVLCLDHPEHPADDPADRRSA